jgi:hypothetical protein
MLALAVSCVEDDPAANPGTGIVVAEAPDDFDWSMVRTVVLQVEGMPTDIPVYNTMKVSDKAGNVYLSRRSLMSESFSLQISVPARTDSLIVTYGTVTRRLRLDDELNFSYVTPRPDPEVNPVVEPE